MMKYFFEIFWMIGSGVAFMVSAVVADLYPLWIHTQIAFNVIGAAWAICFVLFVLIRYFHNGY